TTLYSVPSSKVRRSAKRRPTTATVPFGDIAPRPRKYPPRHRPRSNSNDRWWTCPTGFDAMLRKRPAPDLGSLHPPPSTILGYLRVRPAPPTIGERRVCAVS